jgi:hypothetical protein
MTAGVRACSTPTVAGPDMRTRLSRQTRTMPEPWESGTAGRHLDPRVRPRCSTCLLDRVLEHGCNGQPSGRGRVRLHPVVMLGSAAETRGALPTKRVNDLALIHDGPRRLVPGP